MTDNFKLTGRAYIFNTKLNYYLPLYILLLQLIQKDATQKRIKRGADVTTLLYNTIIFYYAATDGKWFNLIYS